MSKPQKHAALTALEAVDVPEWEGERYLAAIEEAGVALVEVPRPDATDGPWMVWRAGDCAVVMDSAGHVQVQQGPTSDPESLAGCLIAAGRASKRYRDWLREQEAERA